HRPFWCALSNLWNAQTGFTAAPPPMILADDATLARFAQPGAQIGELRYLEFSFPRTQPTIDQAKHAVAAVAGVNAALDIRQTQPVATGPSLAYSTSDLR